MRFTIDSSSEKDVKQKIESKTMYKDQGREGGARWGKDQERTGL
jgi:hypothetical protein